jgi:hypothetical protein
MRRARFTNDLQAPATSSVASVAQAPTAPLPSSVRRAVADCKRVITVQNSVADPSSATCRVSILLLLCLEQSCVGAEAATTAARKMGCGPRAARTKFRINSVSSRHRIPEAIVSNSQRPLRRNFKPPVFRPCGSRCAAFNLEEPCGISSLYIYKHIAAKNAALLASAHAGKESARATRFLPGSYVHSLLKLAGCVVMLSLGALLVNAVHDSRIAKPL